MIKDNKTLQKFEEELFKTDNMPLAEKYKKNRY
jgi:hypothetical protein